MKNIGLIKKFNYFLFLIICVAICAIPPVVFATTNTINSDKKIGNNSIRLPNIKTEMAVLTIEGKIKQTNTANKAYIDLNTLRALPQKTLVTKTPWHPEGTQFKGPLLRDVLQLVGSTGKLMHTKALDDYKVDIPVEDATKYDVIVGLEINGQPIPKRKRGPLIIMYPFEQHPELDNSIYISRASWQINHIIVE